MPLSFKWRKSRRSQRWKGAIGETENRKVALRLLQANNSLRKFINETHVSNTTSIRLKFDIKNEDDAALKKLIEPHEHRNDVCHTRPVAEEECIIVLMTKQIAEHGFAISTENLKNIIADVAKLVGVTLANNTRPTTTFDHSAAGTVTSGHNPLKCSPQSNRRNIT